MSPSRSGLTRLLVLAPVALLWGCNPQVKTDSGEAAQAAEAGNKDASPGAPANDGNAPPKDPPQGGCDPGDPGQPKDPNGGQQGNCVDLLVGDGSACIADADIKSQAMDACTSQNMSLQALGEAFDCPGGSTIAKVECCAPGGGGGGGQPANCVGLVVGDGTTCTADADIKSQAMDACTAQNMGLQELYEAFDCGGTESTIAKVLCCAPGGGGGGGGDPGPKDPGQPGNCVGLVVGDGTTCTADADIKSMAMDACAAQSMGMQELGEAFDCGGTESTIAKVLCCAPAAP